MNARGVASGEPVLIQGRGDHDSDTDHGDHDSDTDHDGDTGHGAPRWARARDL